MEIDTVLSCCYPGLPRLTARGSQIQPEPHDYIYQTSRYLIMAAGNPLASGNTRTSQRALQAAYVLKLVRNFYAPPRQHTEFWQHTNPCARVTS